jgi:AraC-like DNA-binding protein
MSRVPLLRAAALVPAIRFLRRIGAPVGRLLERAGLPESTFADVETLVPHRLGARLLEEAARQEGDATLGLQMGLEVRVDTLGYFGRRLCEARTLHGALVTAERLVPSYHSGERVWLARADGEVRLCRRFARSLDALGEQPEQYALGSALGFLRSILGEEWRPPRIHVKQGVAAAVATLPALAGTELVLGCETTAIVLPEHVLTAPLRPLLVPARPRAEAAALWHASGPAPDLTGAVRQVIPMFVRGGHVDVRELADATGMSPRTLQRRLRDEGTSYARVLAEARFDAALELLGAPGTTLADVANALGYSDAPHFARAFRRWTGTTPRQFQRLHDAADGAPRSSAG